MTKIVVVMILAFASLSASAFADQCTSGRINYLTTVTWTDYGQELVQDWAATPNAVLMGMDNGNFYFFDLDSSAGAQVRNSMLMSAFSANSVIRPHCNTSKTIPWLAGHKATLLVNFEIER